MIETITGRRMQNGKSNRWPGLGLSDFFFGLAISVPRKKVKQEQNVMVDQKDMLFDVMTPLGFRVHVTRAYWELIVRINHPAMAGREEDVK